MTETVTEITDRKQTNSPASGEKSWGDRFKSLAFNVGAYIGINYVVNALLSVVLAYAFIRRYDAALERKSKVWGEQLSKVIGLPAKKISQALYWGPRGAVLSAGGTILVPGIKALEDHHSRIEFKIGHMLDWLQEKTGKGNSATQQNLTDYGQITQAMASGSIGAIPDAQMARIKKKHHLMLDASGKLSFMEHRISWLKVIIARAAAWVTAWSTNSIFGFVGIGKALEQSGPPVTRALSKVMPWYSRALKDPDLFSENLANDAVLTMAAAGTHRVVQGMLHKPPQQEDKAVQTADTVSPNRSKILAEGPKDHRSRVNEDMDQPAMVGI